MPSTGPILNFDAATSVSVDTTIAIRKAVTMANVSPALKKWHPHCNRYLTRIQGVERINPTLKTERNLWFLFNTCTRLENATQLDHENLKFFCKKIVGILSINLLDMEPLLVHNI